jgi:hypothetical protein
MENFLLSPTEFMLNPAHDWACGILDEKMGAATHGHAGAAKLNGSGLNGLYGRTQQMGKSETLQRRD